MSLNITGLYAGYQGKAILSDINLSDLKNGQLVGVIGPNAAGKSTLFKSIAGVLNPTSGDIVLNEISLSNSSRAVRAKRVAYMPQAYGCNAILTVFESILLALKQSGGWRVSDDNLSRVSRVLNALDLGHLASRNISALSGGQAQMVAVAQTLVREPELILFDEPTSALDLKHQLQIMSRIKDAISTKGLIGLAALHDLNLAAQFCDRIILIKDGQIFADGSPEEVLGSTQIGEAYGVETELHSTRSGRLYVDAQLATTQLRGVA